jgi:acyl-CoA thioester hydrolase
MPIPWTQPLPAHVAPLLGDFPVRIQQPVAWGEMDAMQHLNNVVYFRYLENSRLEYCRRLGWDRLHADTPVWCILADAYLRFRRPVVYPDTLYIGARVQSLSSDRFVLEHRMVSESLGQITTEGHGTVVAFDYQKQRKAALPEEIVTRLEAIEGRALR